MGAWPTRSRSDEGIRITILFLLLALLLGLVLLPPTLAYGFRWIRSWTGFCVYGAIVLALLGGVVLSLLRGVRLLRTRRLIGVVIIALGSLWLLAFGYVYVGAIRYAG